LFKVDLHVHTVLGGDALIQPEQLVPRAREAGLDAVCVTEHHSYSLSQPFDAISRRAGFPIFRGVEYTADEGHLLIFGVNVGRGDLPPRLPMQRVLDRVHERGGVGIPAHPYQRGVVGGNLGSRVLKLKGLIALETINGSIPDEENERAARAAATMGLSGTGGSDAHGLHVLGRAYTSFSSPIDSEEQLVEALKTGEYRACWNGCSSQTAERGGAAR
jgi:predicted metal-dependent phosphoesterase TrpH